MHDLLLKTVIPVNKKNYLKNPESSDLGKKIISGSIDLLDADGFDVFTFGKLARKIESTEASIYRYFESKHKLLLYLTNWYWTMLEYRLVFLLANINSPQIKLERALCLITGQLKEEQNLSYIDEVKLNRIVINESSKSYLTREVDQENKEGLFSGYKQLVARVSDLILEIKPNFKYPHMLVSTIIEGAHHQRFFATHLPRLTNVVKGEDSIVIFYTELVFKAIK